MSASQAVTQGIHHLGLTVEDIQAARDFFVEALGFQEVGQKPDYPAIFISDGNVMLTLWQAQTAGADFDRKANIGLHHFALRLADGVDFTALYEKLNARADVSIEFKPEALGESGLQHMMCAIPSNIRLELIAA
jgi:catechol 2,3-dioxygenase-like lactoylglutathione lyase family enzyme